ncbi:hypothetical protein AC1031_012785 [Aphanomyces cochlioides]|nr:hypothetical protein AC1031_012785 [Aphanomyces cochlioides]
MAPKIHVADARAYHIVYGRMTGQDGNPIVSDVLRVETTTTSSRGTFALYDELNTDENGSFQLLVPRETTCLRLHLRGQSKECDISWHEPSLWNCSMQVTSIAPENASVLLPSKSSVVDFRTPYLWCLGGTLALLIAGLYFFTLNRRRLPKRPKITVVMHENTPSIKQSILKTEDKIVYLIETRRRIQMAT